MHDKSLYTTCNVRFGNVAFVTCMMASPSEAPNFFACCVTYSNSALFLEATNGCMGLIVVAIGVWSPTKESPKVWMTI